MFMNKNLVEAFREIRDIPYRIPLSAHETDDCCSGKANRLMRVCKEAGIEVRYRVCSFQWSDLGLPDALQQIPHENDCTHVYLEMLIEDHWVVVDPTWDCALEGLLPVSTWNGETDTVIGVPVRDVFSLEESLRIMNESNVDKVIEDDLKKNGAFYKAFNEWLELYRNR